MSRLWENHRSDALPAEEVDEAHRSADSVLRRRSCLGVFWLVPAMPMTPLIKKASHWTLVLGYVLLMVTLSRCCWNTPSRRVHPTNIRIKMSAPGWIMPPVPDCIRLHRRPSLFLFSSPPPFRLISFSRLCFARLILFEVLLHPLCSLQSELVSLLIAALCTLCGEDRVVVAFRFPESGTQGVGRSS